MRTRMTPFRLSYRELRAIDEVAKALKLPSRKAAICTLATFVAAVIESPTMHKNSELLMYQLESRAQMYRNGRKPTNQR
jgi:hypothetical protein